MPCGTVHAPKIQGSSGEKATRGVGNDAQENNRISENRKLLKKKNVHEFRKQKLKPYKKSENRRQNCSQLKRNSIMY